jgi:hypothetical protein
MIDSFADLRDKRIEIQNDMKNYCFICGLARDEVEK